MPGPGADRNANSKLAFPLRDSEGHKSKHSSGGECGVDGVNRARAV
jgi:hypothetical protein